MRFDVGHLKVAGKALPNEKGKLQVGLPFPPSRKICAPRCQASILGAVAGAHFARAVAPAYGIPVLVHSDHCAKKLLPWFDGTWDRRTKRIKNDRCCFGTCEACWRLTRHSSKSMESLFSLLTCWICWILKSSKTRSQVPRQKRHGILRSEEPDEENIEICAKCHCY